MNVFTNRSLLTALHGMGFGCFFLLASFGLVVAALASRGVSVYAPTADRSRLFLKRAYLLVTVALSWFAVLSGTYLIYPWYRATPPPHSDLSHFPRQLLLASAFTAQWHKLGMEWKEHVSFLAPIAVTAVAFVYWRYGDVISRDGC